VRVVSQSNIKHATVNGYMCVSVMVSKANRATSHLSSSMDSTFDTNKS
jgi:hypothetical protein